MRRTSSCPPRRPWRLLDRRAGGLCFKTSSRSKNDVVVVYVAVVFHDFVGGYGVGSGCTNPSKRADGFCCNKRSKLFCTRAIIFVLIKCPL